MYKMFIFFGTEILLKGIYIREIIQEKGKVLCNKDHLCSTTYNCENIKTFQICCHNRIKKQVIEYPVDCIAQASKIMVLKTDNRKKCLGHNKKQ